MAKDTILFTYEEVKEDDTDIFQVLKVKEESYYEAIIIRLLSGTINIIDKKDNNCIKARTNYLMLGTVENQDDLLTIDLINRCILPDIDEASINCYILYNKSNNDFFRRLLTEMTHFIVCQSKERFTEAFVHLYRISEYISYSFPLIYAAQATSYLNTFDTIKSFFGNGTSGGELGFFKEFQKIIIDKDILDLNYEMSYIVNADIVCYVKKSFETIAKEAPMNITDNSILIQNKSIFSLILSLRNKYFHMASKSRNLLEPNIDMNNIFNIINNACFNWIAYIYNQIALSGISRATLIDEENNE